MQARTFIFVVYFALDIPTIEQPSQIIDIWNIC